MDDLLSWMAKAEYCRRSGQTDGQIRGRINRKEWIKGQHYAVRNRRVYINWREAEAWITEHCTTPAEPEPHQPIPANE